jgi:hypothetical protein
MVHSPAVQHILQRPQWHGTPVDLGELFVLHKNGREAKCLLWTHLFGWELRLVIGSRLEVLQIQVCRTQEEGLTTGEHWKAAMIAKGWTAP